MNVQMYVNFLIMGDIEPKFCLLMMLSSRYTDYSLFYSVFCNIWFIYFQNDDDACFVAIDTQITELISVCKQFMNRNSVVLYMQLVLD